MLSSLHSHSLLIHTHTYIYVLTLLPSRSGQPVDLQDLFFRYTFDAFGQLAFGVRVGCVESDVAPPFAYAFDQANIITAMRCVYECV